MTDENVTRRVRAAFGNGLVWGVSWSVLWVLAVAAFTALGLVGIGPGFSWLQALGAAVRFGAAFGIIGFVAGAVFSGFMRLVCHGRSLSDLSPVRFGIGGAVFGALFVPAFLLAMNWLSGDGIPALHHVLDDAPFGAMFGGAAAAASIGLAQRADRLLTGGSEEADLRESSI